MTRLRTVGAALLILVAITSMVSAQGLEEVLNEQLPLLGHRNWIAVVDSAYPAQNSPGITTVVVPSDSKLVIGDRLAAKADHLDVAEFVLRKVDAAPHVAGAIFTDAELPYVKEEVVPGITEYRQGLAKVLKGRNVTSKLHEDIIADLDEAGKTFRILLIKTDLTLPFTSVFIRLDCQYWSPEMDAALRKDIADVAK